MVYFDKDKHFITVILPSAVEVLFDKLKSNFLISVCLSV